MCVQVMHETHLDRNVMKEESSADLPYGALLPGGKVLLLRPVHLQILQDSQILSSPWHQPDKKIHMSLFLGGSKEHDLLVFQQFNGHDDMPVIRVWKAKAGGL